MKGDTFDWYGKLQLNPLKEIVSKKEIAGFKLNENYALKCKHSMNYVTDLRIRT